MASTQIHPCFVISEKGLCVNQRTGFLSEMEHAQVTNFMLNVDETKQLIIYKKYFKKLIFIDHIIDTLIIF
jgi:hypothetical protein